MTVTRDERNPMRTRSNRIPAEERRAEILRHATQLFAERGFGPTTMDDIADRANITKRTLYRYVTSKDELLFEIHSSFTDPAGLSGDWNDGRDLSAVLGDAIQRHVQMVTDRPTEIRVFFEERKHLTPERALSVEESRRAWEDGVVSVIASGRKSGSFRDLPATQVTQLILGAMTEMYRWYRPDGPHTPSELGDMYEQLFLRGISKDRTAQLPTAAGVPATPPPPPKGEQNKERVREAAIKSFAKLGYHASSMRELAEVADVTKGAVMYHAGYKDDLLAEIHTITFQQSIEVLTNALAADDSHSAADSLYRIVSAQMGFMAYHREGIAVINDNMRYLDPKSYTRVDQLRQQWLGVFGDTLERGFANGEFVGAEVRFVNRVLVGMLNSVARWYDPAGRLSPQDLADLVWQVLLFGIEADSPVGD